MASRSELENMVRAERLRRGWSQDDLARRSGLSRTGVSAIETSRLIPSTAAALALALAFDRRVEDLFSLPGFAPGGGRGEPEWAWAPRQSPCRYWRAEVAGRTRLYPVEASPLGVIPHDGLCPAGAVPHDDSSRTSDPRSTLVVACCDPAVGLLAAELAHSAGVRLIVLPRSSRSALDLLGTGLVHAAGVHLGRAGNAKAGNASAVLETIGPGYSLLCGAEWEEGVTFAGADRIKTVREAAKRRLRWVGREPGSGARQCLDELLGDRRPPRRLARDHRAVAEAVRAGWAEAGICLRLASDEAGLSFLSVRREPYDLCIADAARDDPRIKALLNALRSPSYRRQLGELPGYNTAETGQLRRVV